jgi:S-DNA-T family DNA segregation ATPase FtsK/SpoIIIE
MNWINGKKESYDEARARRREERLIEEANRQQEEVEEPAEKEIEAPPISQKEIEAVVEEIDEELNEQKAVKRKILSSYSLPPISLLEKDRGKPNTGDVKANAQIIKLTLQNFGIDVEMDEITVGPTVTRYALKPAQGVKLSRILSLQNDLSLSLAAHPIRIEAPIPGKSLVGIEIPNKAKSIIGFASLMGDEVFQKNPKPLTVALGKNVAGKAIYANLAKMPHGLIAGATGSGKSVTIHAIITSLLYRNTPEHLRFIFVDPKRVELTLYNKIPHLLTPVITDAKKAILALKWAAKEMDRRYDILEKETVRDIESYHKNIVDPFYAKKQKDEDKGPDKMPYIVIVIDELADIMQAYPRELESAIVRLAQMSRAVGIHLILSTQRPSVNVITGLIKANVPTRIALKVASQIDSRTILDSPGAEELIGQGDMLYMSGEMASAERIQCAYITEDEVKKVVKYISEENFTEIAEDITQQQDALASDNSIFNASLEPSDHDDDDMYEQARQVVIETQKASTSFLQRKLGVGYARAARLIDQLEERGIVGPGNGAKPRDVLEKAVNHEQTTF